MIKVMLQGTLEDLVQAYKTLSTQYNIVKDSRVSKYKKHYRVCLVCEQK